jgi:hypothetical protein
MTNDELTLQLSVKTKNTLTALAAAGAVTRHKNHGVFVYFSVNPALREQQALRRAESEKNVLFNAGFDPYDTVEVLAAYIKGIRTPDQVTTHIRHKRRNIGHATVSAIFEYYELEQGGDGKKNTF